MTSDDIRSTSHRGPRAQVSEGCPRPRPAQTVQLAAQGEEDPCDVKRLRGAKRLPIPIPDRGGRTAGRERQGGTNMPDARMGHGAFSEATLEATVRTNGGVDAEIKSAVLEVYRLLKDEGGRFAHGSASCVFQWEAPVMEGRFLSCYVGHEKGRKARLEFSITGLQEQVREGHLSQAALDRFCRRAQQASGEMWNLSTESMTPSMPLFRLTRDGRRTELFGALHELLGAFEEQ